MPHSGETSETFVADCKPCSSLELTETFQWTAVLLCTSAGIPSVHFWALPGKAFRTDCKGGTALEFIEAKWVDSRNFCGEVDVADILNMNCRGRRSCNFVPLAQEPIRFGEVHMISKHLMIPDTCGDTGSRKLVGVYHCFGTLPI